MNRSMTGLALATGVCVVLSSACGGGEASTGGGAGGDSTTLKVSAASSLTDAFGELEATFEANSSGTDVTFTFDSSSTLAEQVIQGAPVDVLATADEATMQGVVDEGLTATDPVPIAQNKLTVVTPADNPADIDSISDLDSGAVDWAVCVPDAPCGVASEKLLSIVNVDAQPVTEEANVRDVLTKVTTGEVDAGLVYVSDAQAAADDVTDIEVPQADQALNSDVIAPLTDAAEPELAQAWVDLVASDEGQRVLESYGFLPPA